MKILSKMTIFVLTASALVVTRAATVNFNDADGADSFISTAGNWTTGTLPISPNDGTISINATYDSNVNHSNYNILHTAGNISRGNGFSSFALGTNSSWEMDGAGAAITQARGVNLGAGSSFTLLNGNANLSDNNRDTVVSGAGASMTVSGGIMTIGRDLIVNTGGTFTIDGGSISGIDQFITQAFSTAANGFFFNGGSTTADNFQLDTAGTATFGGSTAGSLSLLTGLGNGVTLDWTSGSLMSLTIAGADLTYYQGLYTANTLRFEGSNANPFASNFQVSGDTISLSVASIPELSSLALLGFAGLIAFFCRRRS